LVRFYFFSEPVIVSADGGMAWCVEKVRQRLLAQESLGLFDASDSALSTSATRALRATYGCETRHTNLLVDCAHPHDPPQRRVVCFFLPLEGLKSTLFAACFDGSFVDLMAETDGVGGVFRARRTPFNPVGGLKAIWSGPGATGACCAGKPLSPVVLRKLSRSDAS
jgi:hypothetical protein